MKKGILYFILPAALLVFFGCKKENPPVFSQKTGVYFNAADTIVYSFAKYPNRLIDTLKIPVIIEGNASGVARAITVDKGTSPDVNAVEGVNYKLLGPFVIPAQSYTSVISVVVYRTGDLDSVTQSLVLKLTPNADFGPAISSKTSIKIKIVYLQKPSTWGEIGGTQWAGYSTNLGTWTKIKYKLVLNALYDPVSDTTTTEFIYSRFGSPAVYTQDLQLVKNYIRTNYPGNYSTPLGIGATLKDPDANNLVIQVGPANY